MTTPTRKPRRLTNTQKVLRRFPDAYCHTPIPDGKWSVIMSGPSRYYPREESISEWCRTPAQAWADAASRL